MKTSTKSAAAQKRSQTDTFRLDINNRLYGLSKLSLEMLSITEANKLLGFFLDNAKKIMGAKYAVLGILQENKKELRYFFVNKINPEEQLKLGKSLMSSTFVKQLIKGRKVLKINDARKLSLNKFLPGHPAVKCVLGAPIYTRARFYGFLYFADKTDKTVFHAEDESLIVTLVTEIAALYENLELYSIIQQYTMTLEVEMGEVKYIQNKLSNVEELFRHFAEDTHAVFWRTTPKMEKIIYASPAYEEIWGRSRKELYQNPKSWIEAVVPEDKPKVEDFFYNQLYKDGPLVNIAYRILRPDGSIRHIFDRGLQVKDKRGKLLGLLGIATDTTSYLNTINRIEIQKQITALLKSATDMQAVAPKALKLVCESFNWDIAEIWIYDESKKKLFCSYLWCKEELEATGFNKEILVNTNTKFSEMVLRETKPTWVSEYSQRQEARFLRKKIQIEFRGAFGMPIHFQNEVLGVVSFFSRQIQKPDPDMENMVEMFNPQLGSFIRQVRTERQLGYVTMHDTLTGLLNRNSVEKILNTIISISNSALLVIFALGVDQFKLINSAMGYDAGDIVLRTVAERIRKMTLRENDLVGRLDADRFAFVFRNAQSMDEVIHQAHKILTAIKEPIFIKTREIYLTASIGISLYPQDGEDSGTLLKNADAVLARVQEEGGNFFQFCATNLPVIIAEKLTLESDLRKALSGRQFILYYQPIVDLKTGAIVSLEALIRWKHPEKGIVPPLTFLGVAEETGLIVPIGEWVLKEACKQITQGNITVPVSINLSVKQFQRQYNLIDNIKKMMEEFNIHPDKFIYEVTETAIMTEEQRSLEVLTELRKMGNQISYDDFGTGYSSFSDLKFFIPDKVKLDKFFIGDIPDSRNDTMIVVGIIALCHTLGIKVVAEGVETAEQLKFLIDAGCDEMQGYYFSPPVPINEIKSLIENKVKLKFPN